PPRRRAGWVGWPQVPDHASEAAQERAVVIDADDEVRIVVVEDDLPEPLELIGRQSGEIAGREVPYLADILGEVAGAVQTERIGEHEQPRAASVPVAIPADIVQHLRDVAELREASRGPLQVRQFPERDLSGQR